MNVHRFVVGADHPDVGDATIRVDAHRRRFGPYSAAGSVVRAIVPTIDDVALVQRHDVEILTVAPTLAAGVTNERATLTSAARADLIPGKKVFVVATPAAQGTFVAQRVLVEKNGVAPPM